MQWGIRNIIAVSVCGAVTVGLSVANEVRRQAILTQNETIVQKAQKDLEDLRRLGFLERDIPVQSLDGQLRAAHAEKDLALQKWWMISIKTNENQAKQLKLKQLLSLNRKLLKSYRQDLNDLRKFGFPENDPRVTFSRHKVAQIVVELAHLVREYKHACAQKACVTDKQVLLVKQILALNQQEIEGYKSQIEGFLGQGMDLQHEKIREIRTKMSAKLAENGLLERKLNR